MSSRHFFRFVATFGLCLVQLVNRAFAAPGDLDIATFGSGPVFGTVLVPVGAAHDEVASVALQGDGRFVLLGSCSSGAIGSPTNYCLVRLSSDGQLDPTFGAGGKVSTPFGTGSAFARSVAVQPDGKILAAGTCTVNEVTVFCVARFQTNGTLDATLQGTGKVTTSISPVYSEASAVHVQPDGKFIVVGDCASGSSRVTCIARYLADGQLDATFGNSGTVVNAVPNAMHLSSALSLAPDGSILVAGSCLADGRFNFCISRYDAGGNIDPALATAGPRVLALEAGVSSYGSAILLQPDGKVLLAGSCSSPGPFFGFCAIRVHPDFAIDSTFANGGIATTVMGPVNGYVLGARLLADGRMILAGQCSNGVHRSFCMLRYTPEGSLDPIFGVGGRVITAIRSRDDVGQGLLIQPDGKVVVAGTCWSETDRDFCVARYQGGPFGYRACTLDIDGDGKVTATGDLLIGIRVALGITGPNVTQGIMFAPHALRADWVRIRDYLVSQCGLSIQP